MKQSTRRRIAALAVTAAACVGTLFTPVGAHAQEGDYQIFPTPQKVVYQEGSVEFADSVTTVVEDGIDAETEARLKEAVKLKAKEVKSADAVPANGTAVLVGVHGSGKQVDSYVKQLVDAKKLSYDAGLFEQTDANLVALLPAEDGAANRTSSWARIPIRRSTACRRSSRSCSKMPIARCAPWLPAITPT